MSPLIFNMIMDEIIEHLQNLAGIKINNKNINCLDFADDILLLANTVQDDQIILNELPQFLHNKGLEINIAKCKALSAKTVPSKKKNFSAQL